MSEEVVLEVENESDEGAPATDGAPEADRAEAGPDVAPPPPEAAEEPAVPPEPRDPGARRRLVLGVAGLVVIVGLAVALIISQVQLSDQEASNADRTAALAAAKAAAVDVATYSYLHLHQDFGRVEAESTPAFRRTFIKSSDNLSKVLVQYKATASAKVVQEAVQSISGSKAVVLLFVNQSVKNTAQQGVSTDNSRIEVTLVRSGDRWLLQKLKLV